MSSIKKIMVPLAFSPFSKGMLKYAAELAQGLEAELLLVNVINERDVEAVERIASFGYEVNGANYVKEVEKDRISALEQIITELDFPEERMIFKFKVGRPSDVLLALAIEEQVDMIVMGIKAKSDLVHAFTGSVAERLFRRSPVTLVSYRDEHNAAKLRERLQE
jgi:nucleotide-binding universal stress UspA family protein